MRVRDRPLEVGDVSGAVADLVVLVIRGDRLEAAEDFELASVLLDYLAGRPQELRVM